MERTVLWNGESVPYQLHYKKVKNVNIRITVGGIVHVSANRGVKAEEVDHIIQKKAAWIVRAKAAYIACQKETQMPRTYVTGEPVCFLGHIYHLCVEMSDREQVSIQEQNVVLQLRAPADETKRKKLFDTWYHSLCYDMFERMIKRVFPLFKAYRIPLPSFRIRKMKTRWGSCSPQKCAITLNLYLAQAPAACVEYVIAHELAHLVQPNHSWKFYKVLDDVMPTHRERKQLLREQKINCYEIP